MAEAVLPKKPFNSVLIDKLKGIPDNRKQFKVQYELAEVLFLVYCSTICGYQSFDEIADFGQYKLSWLRKYLPYRNGIPSHDTINRLLSVLNVKHLEKVLNSTYGCTLELPNGSVVSIDGKRLTGSATKKEQQTHKSKGGRHCVVMVNVYCEVIRTCLASIQVSSKAGEKNAIEEILEVLDLSNCILTLDAGFCYTDVVKKIVEVKADYVIGLKSNQPKLLAVAEELVSQDNHSQTYKGATEDSHGRKVQRTCKVVNFSAVEPAQLERYKPVLSKWEGLKCFIVIYCMREVKATGVISNETRYYLASQEITPKPAIKLIRGHWGIENLLHWVLDAIMGEDDSKIRKGNAPSNFSIIKKLALNAIANNDDPKTSIKRKIKRCHGDVEYLENTLKIA